MSILGKYVTKRDALGEALDFAPCDVLQFVTGQNGTIKAVIRPLGSDRVKAIGLEMVRVEGD